MDTNYLLGREQLSLWKAKNAASPEARNAHKMLARGYADVLAARNYRFRYSRPNQPSGSDQI